MGVTLTDKDARTYFYLELIEDGGMPKVKVKYFSKETALDESIVKEDGTHTLKVSYIERKDEFDMVRIKGLYRVFCDVCEGISEINDKVALNPGPFMNEGTRRVLAEEPVKN